MKFSISFPDNGTAKMIEIKDEKKWALFYDKQMGDEVEGDLIGDEFKGYVFKISGGQDHQGFAMIQGVFANERVRLLMRECHKCFNIRRKGYKKKKSVRGCIVGPDIKILHLVIVIKGEADIPELTDKMESKRLGPKRASKIAQLFSIEKANYASNNYKGYFKAICAAAVRRQYTITKGGDDEGEEGANAKVKNTSKAPKIQRLVTNVRVRRKKNLRKFKRNRQLLAISQRSKYEKELKAYR